MLNVRNAKLATIPFSIIAVLILVLSSFAVVYIFSINLSEQKSQYNTNSIVSSINSAANSLGVMKKAY